MAQHIQFVRTSGIPQVTKVELFSEMRPGDLVFCWGNIPISHGIEQFTGGPSHVLKVWLPFATGPWLTLEAEYSNGVRFGPFSDYLSYPGDIVLCRRPLTLDQVEAELTFGSTLLDYKYDSIEFVSLVARRFINKFPLFQPQKELYCSGLMQAIAAVSLPFDIPDKPWATPGQLYEDASVTAICALLEGTQ
jgi:hypothetical protein